MKSINKSKKERKKERKNDKLIALGGSTSKNEMKMLRFSLQLKLERTKNQVC